MSAPLASSLQSTQFESVRDFQTYFQALDELPVAAAQPLIIRGLPSFALERTGQDNALACLIQIINCLLLPLAKSIEPPHLDFDSNFMLELTPTSLTARLTVPWNLKLLPQRAPLLLRISSLFEMMIFSGQFKVVIASEQPLIATGLTSAEEKKLLGEGSSKKNLAEVIAERAPSGFHAKLKTSSGLVHYELKEGQLCSTSSGIREISLKKIRLFGDCEAFCKEIAEKGEIVIHDFECLTISCPELESYSAEYEKYGEGISLSKIDFLFSQMAVATGKTVHAEISGDGAFIIKGSELSSDVSQGSTLSLTFEESQFVSSSKNIQERLLSSSLIIQPNQKALLYDFTEKELLELFNEGESNEDLCLRLSRLFSKHSSQIGYHLTISSDNKVEISLHRFENHEGEIVSMLALSGEEGFTFEQQRVDSSEELLSQVIYFSHPELLQDLFAGEQIAIAQLLFRLLFHFCCEVIEEDEKLERSLIGPLFLPETVQKIQELKENEAFMAANLRLKNDLESQQILAHILNYSPDEFRFFDPTKLELPLRFLLEQLKQLASQELNRGYFFTMVMKWVVKAHREAEEEC